MLSAWINPKEGQHGFLTKEERVWKMPSLVRNARTFLHLTPLIPLSVLVTSEGGMTDKNSLVVLYTLDGCLWNHFPAWWARWEKYEGAWKGVKRELRRKGAPLITVVLLTTFFSFLFLLSWIWVLTDWRAKTYFPPEVLGHHNNNETKVKVFFKHWWKVLDQCYTGQLISPHV